MRNTILGLIASAGLISGEFSGTANCVFDRRPNGAISFIISDDGEFSRDSSSPVICLGELLLNNLGIVSLSSKALSNIKLPDDLPPSIPPQIVVKLNDNSIQSIAEDAFSDSNFTQIVLAGNPLTGTVAPNAFRGLPSLQELVMVKTQISSISKDMFANINPEANVLLDESPITLSDGAFENVNVKSLSLRACGFTSVQEGSFSGLTTENLVLSFNNLQDLAENSFKDKAIRGLTLSNGNLTSASLTPQLFAGAVQLKNLNLDNNALTSVTSLFDGLNLTTLSMSNIKLESFDKTTLNCSVENLILNDNLIPSFPVDSFENNPELKNLELQAIGLTALLPGTFSSLSDLSRLNLDFNPGLTNVDGLFDGLSLSSLSMNNCGLTELTSFTFGTTILKDLSLENNPITSIASDTFSGPSQRRRMDNERQLVNINLKGAQLTSLPPQLFDGQLNLAIVLLDGNTQLEQIDQVFIAPLSMFLLSLKNCGIKKISTSTFDGLQVNELYLEANKISSIENMNVIGLRHLDLTSNSIPELPSGFFQTFGSTLEYLSLIGNDLQIIRSGQFSNLFLGELTFTENRRLSQIEPFAFENATFGKLFFRNTALTYLESGIFNQLTAQEINFDLSETNTLTGFHEDTFTNVVNLETLEFKNCPFTDNILPPLSNDFIRQLFIPDCGLNVLPSGAFSKLPSLFEVIIDDNDFGELKTEWFAGAPSSLLELQAVNSGLQSFEEGFFATYSHIDFFVGSNNEFTRIKKEDFLGASKMLFTFFNGNDITEIEAGSFADFPAGHKFLFDSTIECENIQGLSEYLSNTSNNGFINGQTQQYQCTAPNGTVATVAAASTDPCLDLNLPCCSRQESTENEFFAYENETNSCVTCSNNTLCTSYDVCECLACIDGWYLNEKSECIENQSNGGLSTTAIIIIAVFGSLGLILIVALIAYCIFRRRKQSDQLGGLSPKEFVNQNNNLEESSSKVTITGTPVHAADGGSFKLKSVNSASMMSAPSNDMSNQYAYESPIQEDEELSE